MFNLLELLSESNGAAAAEESSSGLSIGTVNSSVIYDGDALARAKTRTGGLH